MGLDCGEVVGRYRNHRALIVAMHQSKLTDETTEHGADSGPARRVSKAWLFGAYTFLVLWGMAYLVLFFTDRLPF